MINCVLDGIWCPKCKTLHPTLYWHNKYNNYLLNRKEQFEEIKKQRPQLLKDAKYIDTLPSKNLEEEKIEGNCIICNSKTFFKSTLTNHYICSDECKYKDVELNKLP